MNVSAVIAWVRVYYFSQYMLLSAIVVLAFFFFSSSCYCYCFFFFFLVLLTRTFVDWVHILQVLSGFLLYFPLLLQKSFVYMVCMADTVLQAACYIKPITVYFRYFIVMLIVLLL